MGHDIWDRNTRTGQLGLDIRDRTARKDSRDRTVLTSWLDRQPGQVSLEGTEMTELPGYDTGVRRAVANVAWAGQLEQEDSVVKFK